MSLSIPLDENHSKTSLRSPGVFGTSHRGETMKEIGVQVPEPDACTRFEKGVTNHLV